MSDKEVSQDGARCTGMPPDLLKHFHFSLLELQEKIQDGKSSCVAFMQYVYRSQVARSFQGFESAQAGH